MSVYRTGSHWDTPNVTVSKETHQLLKTMMQESKLTNLQQRNVERSVNKSGMLPQHKVKRVEVERPKKALPKVLNARSLTVGGGIRKQERIAASGAYENEVYRPKPTSDMSKEKSRFVDKLIYGEQKKAKTAKTRLPRSFDDDDVPLDRFDELVAEIRDRRAFLEDMISLGQGSKYRAVISTEISQKLREMEVIDQKRTKELAERLNEAL